MSNLTPDDVNTLLNETRTELEQEDLRLWQGLEDEKVSRIAGDAANANEIQLTNTALAAQESRLSVEVVQREEGDLRNISSLTELAQALSDYRIKTDLEINNEKIARQQLGVDLNYRVDTFTSTFDHQFLMVYQAIQDYQNDTDNTLSLFDDRIARYEQMLQDITTDSIQITMDNGEINMGAWTILSQARQWDLEILGKFKDYQASTDQSIDEALQDIQNQLPLEEDIINKAIDALSQAPIILELDSKLNSSIEDIDTIHADLLAEITNRQNEMIAYSQTVANQMQTNQAALVSMVEAESAARIDELQREASIRQQELVNEANERSAEIEEKLIIEEGERLQQIAQLQDGLTQEIQHRIDGDTASITALDNYKVSNDAALANVMQDLSANVTATSANASAITALDTRLTDNETVAASAVTKAETALTQTSALATQVDSVKASIDGLETELATKVDSTAFSALQADVSTIDGKVTSQGNQITSVSANVTVVDKLTRLTSQGKPLRDDPNFKTGANLTIYNAQTGYTLTRQAITAGNPSGSTHEYRMAMTQAITGNGIGFYPSPNGIASAANKVFLFKMVLKAPTGSVINIYKNDTGTPSTYEMLGNNLGTGKFETYYFWLQCGPTGTFSTAGHVAIAQGTAPVGTASAPFEAIVASYEVWDVTTVNDGIPKEWADKVDASATAITNLQSTVTSQGNQITSTSSAVTVLTNRVTTVENAVSTKAETSTVSALDSKVTTVDGKVTTNTNAITSLSSRVTSVEGSLSNKVDASVLNNYSTTTEMSTAIASGITAYDASLVIGGDNLAANSDKAIWYPYANSSLVQAEEIVNSTLKTKKAIRVSSTGGTDTIKAVRTISGLELSANVVMSVKVQNTGTNPILVRCNGIDNHKKDPASITLNAGEFKFFEWVGVTRSAYNFIQVIVNSTVVSHDISFETSELKVEYGTKATAWTPSSSDIQSAINANASAITTTQASVTALDGRITSNSNEITTLKNRVTTVEGTVSSKADASALTSLTNRVVTAEGEIDTISTQATVLTNSLVNSSNAIVMTGGTPAGDWLLDPVYSKGEYSTILEASSKNGRIIQLGNNSGNDVVWAHPNNWMVFDENKTYRLRARVRRKVGSGTIYLGVCQKNADKSSYVTTTNTLVDNMGSSNYTLSAGTPALDVWQEYSWIIKGRSTGAATGSGTEASPKTVAKQTAFISPMVIANYQGATGIVELDYLILEDAEAITLAQANSSAIQTLTSNVNTIDGRVTTNSNNITTLSNRLTTAEGNITATSNALTGLTSRVTTAEGNITSLGNQTTTLNATLNSVVDVITIKDTRSTNELPNWYWVNYPQRKVIEFKQAATLGLTGMGTYVSLETTVQFLNATGGSIKQVARSGDELLAQHRYSIGSGTAATWSVWKPYIKDLTDANTANASAINTLNSQVTSINGTLTAQSTALTKVEADLSGLVIGGANTYDNTSTPVDKLVGNASITQRNTANAPNGFLLTGDSTSQSSVRIRDVITEVGWWTISFYARGSQNAAVGFTLDIVDGPGHVVRTTADNTWKYFEFSRYVTNYDPTYSFINLASISWAYIYLKDIKVERGSRASAWTPSNAHVLESLSANASAITALDSKVTTIDGKVTTQASSITQLQTTVNGHTSSLQVQGNSINGIQAEYTIKTDVNGLVAGIGLINSGSTSAVGINANYFYVGNSSTGKKPFIVTTSPQTIDGITYPAGTWIHSALIANATIGSAKIASLDATKITSGFIDAARIEAGTITTDKLLVGGGNMLYGGLDNFQNFTTTPPNNSVGATLSLLTTHGLFGPKRIQHTSTAASSYSYLHPTANTNAGWVRLRPNNRYILSAYVMTSSSTATSVILSVQPREGTTTTGAGGGTSSTLSISSADGWKRISVVFVPTGTDPHLSYYIRHVSSGITTYWDGFMLEEVPAGVSAPSPFTLGSMTRIDGGQIVTDSITADKISVANLSAISANLGTLVTYKDPAQPLKARTVMTGSLITVYDDNNKLRVKLGVW